MGSFRSVSSESPEKIDPKKQIVKRPRVENYHPHEQIVTPVVDVYGPMPEGLTSGRKAYNPFGSAPVGADCIRPLRKSFCKISEQDKDILRTMNVCGNSNAITYCKWLMNYQNIKMSEKYTVNGGCFLTKYRPTAGTMKDSIFDKIKSLIT